MQTVTTTEPEHTRWDRSSHQPAIGPMMMTSQMYTVAGTDIHTPAPMCAAEWTAVTAACNHTAAVIAA